jgi:hypothetical protein
MEIIIGESNTRNWLIELQELSLNESKYQISELIKMASSIANKYIGNYVYGIEKEIRHGSGYIVFKGIPIDYSMINTITGVNSEYNKPSVSELSLLGITAVSGFNPFSFLQEKKGKIIHEVIPKGDCGNSVSSDGSVEFKLHADGAYLNRLTRPEVLSLMCLNNESKTHTNLILIDDIIRSMEASDINVLSSLNYIHISPETFKTKLGSCKVKSSIIDRVDGFWEVKVATHNTEPCTEEARLALEKFIEMASFKANTIYWEPGDLVLFSNLRCLHGRGAVTGKRWLKRCYGSKSLSLASVVDLNQNKGSDLYF